MSAGSPGARRYFVNDVICRVQDVDPLGGGGRVVDIGVVEFPTLAPTILTRNGTARPQSHREFVEGIRAGFAGQFYVTWRHCSHAPLGPGGKGYPRELVSAQDDNIFLLDRQLCPGMFVKKVSDGSIGMVKSVDVLMTMSLQPALSDIPDVVHNIRARDLEWDWDGDSVLGHHFMTNGYIGQVVEVMRSAQLSMELGSLFEVHWTETLAEDKSKKLLGNEIHHRFCSVGDTVTMSLSDFSSVTWVSDPEGKGALWPFLRLYEYAGQAATVEYIFTNRVHIKWLEKILSPSTTAPKAPPREWLTSHEFGNLIKQTKLTSLTLPLPETKQIGDSISLFNAQHGYKGDRQAYDTWANSHLYGMKLRTANLTSVEAWEPPPEKRLKLDPSTTHVYNGMLSPKPWVSPNGKVLHGRLISRSSCVAVHWSSLSFESVSSIEVEPVFLDRTLGYQPGTVVWRMENSYLIQRQEAAFGVVVRNDTESRPNETNVKVNYFKIPFQTNVPEFCDQAVLPLENVLPHPIYDHRPGCILTRSSPYDEFTAGVYLGASETGELILSCPHGLFMKVWPNRVIPLNSKPTYNRNRKLETDPFWLVRKGRGRHNGFSLPMDLLNLNPPSSAFIFQVEKEFVDKKLQTWDWNFAHHFGVFPEYEIDLANKRYTGLFLEQEIGAAAILPEGIWMKYVTTKPALYFAAMEGPVGTVYEDTLLFFEFALPQIWKTFRGDAHIRIDNYFSHQVIPGISVDGPVSFPDESFTEAVDSFHPRARVSPSLAAILLQIRETSLKADPVCINPSQGMFSLDKLPFMSKEAERRSVNLDVLIVVTASVTTQLLNHPFVWFPEMLSYYRVHVPKFCARVTRWITGEFFPEEGPKFPLLPISNSRKRDELLDKVGELMDVYAQKF